MRATRDTHKTQRLKLLDDHRILTLATLRPDGWPQTTSVGYANDGLTLYFLCGKESQKAANLARDEPVTLAHLHDSGELLGFFMGKNTPERQDFIIGNLKVEKDLVEA